MIISNFKTITFGTSSGTPSSYTEKGLTVKPSSTGGHLHLQDTDMDGSIDLMNHSSSYRFTATAQFTVESFDVVYLSPVGASGKFTAFRCSDLAGSFNCDIVTATHTVSKTGKVVLGNGSWTNLTYFSWSTNGTMAIDNLKIFLGTKPVISSLSPSSATAGGASFTLTVNGSHFQSGATVKWNGSDRSTTFISSGEVRATISETDIATAGTVAATVKNPDLGTSQPVSFTISSPLPKISSLSPTSATAGGAGFTLTVNRTETHDGTAFVSNSEVRWNGSSRTTTFVNSTQLTAAISAADIATAGTATVTVFNPSPGGGTSNSATFTINNPIPVTTGLNPSQATAGGSGFTLTVAGSQFVSTSKVHWNGFERATDFVSSTQLNATISAGDIAAAGDAAVTVVSPEPGGGTSNAQTFSVVPRVVPAITSLDPSSVTAGGPAFTLTVNGSNFEAGFIVQWNGQDRSTTFVTNIQLRAEISASDIASAGTISVTVRDPAAGGATSNGAAFTVLNPVPLIANLSPSAATVGDAGLTVTINGSGFVAQSIVKWNGAERAAAFVSSSQLTFSVSASDLSTAAVVTVSVVNGEPGGGTATANFTISNPAPVLTSLDPTSATVGGSDFTLTVRGSGFVTGSTVRWNGTDRATTFVSSSELSIIVPSSDLASAGTVSITVLNASPGGGTSAALSFTIGNPTPFLLSLNPSSASVGAASFTLVVSGGGFVSGSVVRWNGSDRITTFVSETQLTATIPASDLTAPGTASVTVLNPSPGGGTSNTLSFTVSSQFLYFPVLFKDSEFFTGFALANISETSASLTLEAFSDGGIFVATTPDLSSDLVTLVGQRQVAKITSEVFPDTDSGWFRVSHPNSGVLLKGFFLHGRADLSTIDGVDAADRLSTDLVFSLMAKDGSGESQVILVNPNTSDATLRLELFGAAGSTGLVKQTFTLAKLSRIEKTVSQLFEGLDLTVLNSTQAVEGQLYVRVTSDLGLFGLGTFAERSSSRDFVALRAQDVSTEAGQKLVFAHAVEGSGYETWVSVINLDANSADLTIKLVLDSGELQTVSRTVLSGGVMRARMKDLFPSLSSNGTNVGYLEVSSSGLLLGNVTFRYQQTGATAALRGQKSPSAKLTFSHVAVQDVNVTNDAWLTGIALLNPSTTADAIVKITVRKPDGTEAGVRDNFLLRAGERKSRLLVELVREVKNQAGGYILVESSQPLYGFELFGDWNLKKLAAVPAQ